MKITRRQLRKIIQESIYGRGGYKSGPIDPMTRISTGDGTFTSRIPANYQDKLDALASKPNTSAMAGVMAPQVQTPDLVIPFEGESYEEKAFKGDSYSDELKKHAVRNPALLILPIKNEINRYIPNLESLLDEKIGSKISSSSQLSYDWYTGIQDMVVANIDGKIIDLDNMSLLAIEALFGSDSEQLQKAKSFMPYELYEEIAGGGGISELVGNEFIQFINKSENSLLFKATQTSFSAYIAYKAITTGAKANFGAEWIGAIYCDLDSGEPQEIKFYSTNKLGPAIFNAARFFDNITIEGEKILSNARIKFR